MLNPYFAFGVPFFLLLLYIGFALFRRSSHIPYLGFVLFYHCWIYECIQFPSDPTGADRSK